jgi:hypothetical protein
MNAWARLGLNDDADERSIKRQYAKLLKVTRPDDDLEAFQQLREAYEQALNWARMRADDEAFEGETATVELTSQAQRDVESSLPSTVSLERPAVSPVAPAMDAQALARKTAEALVEHTDALTLQAQHQAAVEQGCDQPFQQRVLERCLDDDEPDTALLKAAVDHLRWLTPWQTLRLTADQEIHLTQALLERQRQVLEVLLTEGREREFLATLENLSNAPWLTALERRDQFQRWLMFFLHNHEGWSAALFDRICTLFGWDDRKAVFPEPEFIWRQLIERCEKYACFEHWQRLIDSGKTDSVEEKAARMVLKPGRRVDQLRLARFCSIDVWNACERLCSTINNRYPQMLERFPEADLNAWRTMKVEPMNAPVWTWLGWLLFTAFFMIPDAAMKGHMDKTLAAVTLLVYPIVMTGLCRVFMRAWRPISLAIEDADEWLSDIIIPRWLHWPASQALVLRHGIPLVLTGAVVSVQGPAALLCYSLLMLAWIFLSPHRHPQIYAPMRQAISRFFHVNRGKLLMSVIAIAVIAMMGALQTPRPAPVVHSPPAALPGQLDCKSQQAMDLMDKECQDSLMPDRCVNNTVEQKISQCWRTRKHLQAELDRQAAQHP